MDIKNKGSLVISLDFELLWGIFDKVNYKEKETYFNNTRKVIPEILNLFLEYKIHCTWATVGMLFNADWAEWKTNHPENLPNYENQSLSAFKYGDSISNLGIENFCFAKELIRIIQNTPNQEIATHTYSHYYCLEKGQTLVSFEADLKQCIKLAVDLGVDLKSLVFPRNQFNQDYLKVCYENGIENVRSNPTNWYWDNVQTDTLKSKIFRTGDAYLGRKDKSYPQSELVKVQGKPLSQKASRLLRPYSSSKALNNLKLKRIMTEMTYAAKKNHIYHLWWHPHNFGYNPEENIADLRKLLEHYKECQEKYDFGSMTMRELNSIT